MKQLLSEQQLREGVRRLADEINTYYQRRPLVIVGVLTGSVVLLADLIRLLDMPLEVGLVQANSYRGAATTPGPLSINLNLLPQIEGRNVLVVDDIFDTGHTLSGLIEQFAAHRPELLRSAVLLRKAGRVQVSLQPDHVGFEIPNEFVVGYGLDYANLYRNLPYVAALEPGEMTAVTDASPRGASSAEGPPS
ncbi:MAG: hypoxanthine phosphoribosyltransferase [Planctomycetia bacterium]|nr:hypoxanthine phosphoribosyltransferase [Planctomycetia bacterium]